MQIKELYQQIMHNINCPYCGKQNNNNDKFCSNCGREI